VKSPNYELGRSCRLTTEGFKSDACDETDGLGSAYVTPDYGWTEGFRGAAVGVRRFDLGPGYFSAHAFGSYQSRSLWQYEVYNRFICSDPHDDMDGSCASPPVFRHPADRYGPGAKWWSVTFPDVYDEGVLGGNTTYWFSPESRLGLTGYWANTWFKVEGTEDLDFQEWSRRPYGGPFGAVGLDGATRAGRFNFFMEGARTFDSIRVNGGGYGLLQRTVVNVMKHQTVEVSLRYYDREFLNPLARPLSQPDKFDGQTARNETGLRAKYTGRVLDDFQLRAEVDLSLWPYDGDAKDTAGTTNLETSLRADFNGWSKLKLSGWTGYTNKDLSEGGRGQCYEFQVVEVQGGEEPPPCSGEMVKVGTRVEYEILRKKLTAPLSYQHRWLDDPKYDDRFRQDNRVWLETRYRPLDYLRLRARIRYLNEALDNDHYMEDSLWTYLEVAYLPSKELEGSLRYDVYQFLDQRDSSLTREPNPEHSLRLELKTRF